MVKKLLSALLALFILSLFPLTVLAGDLPTSTNTINWSTVEVYAYGSGTYKKSLGKVQEAGGQGAFGKEFTPSDGMGIQGFMLRLPRSSFPTTGKWKAQVSIQTGSTSLLLDRMYARGRVQRPNASDLSGQLPKIASDSIPPDFYTVTYNVNSQSLTSVEFFFPYAFPLYGTQRLNFCSVISFRDYESGNINNPVAPLPDASEQNQAIANSVQDTANNTAALVQKQDTIIDQIVDTTQTISNQLHSFWNQLAGEFTNMYNKMNQHHSEDLAANRRNTEDIIDSQESNTTNIINNNNANTDKLANGYDKSRLDNSNAQLNDSIHNMQENEKQLMEDVSNNINSFRYDDYFSRIRGPLSDISYFLNHIYNNMKGLNIPIGFSLTLTIAMLCIGYYRFKGGT